MFAYSAAQKRWVFAQIDVFSRRGRAAPVGTGEMKDDAAALKLEKRSLPSSSERIVGRNRILCFPFEIHLPARKHDDARTVFSNRLHRV